MKKYCIIWLLLSCFIARGQDGTDTRGPDIPKGETGSTASIARFINSNFKTDRDRFHAIHTWVINNIQYDTDSMYQINWNKGEDARITEALRRRKGVCENFAALFNDIAVKCGLTSFEVEGYTKQGGRIDRTGHTWCAVKADGEWLLCDPTWDKDARISLSYFLVSPATFIESHMPFDPMWQLLDYPVSHDEFYRGINAAQKDKAFFNFTDSIKAYSRMDKLQQMQATAERMSRSNKMIELLKNRIAYTNMQIGIICEEKDRLLYNAAVDDLNHATHIFNAFVQYRNSQFLPAKKNIQINDMLNPVPVIIAAAFQKISNIGKVVPDYQYDTGDLVSRLNVLRQRVHEQQDFIKRYFASDESEKKRMFYRSDNK